MEHTQPLKYTYQDALTCIANFLTGKGNGIDPVFSCYCVFTVITKMFKDSVHSDNTISRILDTET